MNDISTLTYEEATRIVREAPVRDKAYRRFSVGQEVGRFLRAKRGEGCRPLTIEAYESVLRRLSLRYADLDSLEPFAEKGSGPDLIVEFIDAEWGSADAHTRKQRFAVVASFFEWAYRTDRVTANPMGKLRRPRAQKHGAARDRVSDTHISVLVSAQKDLRDQAGILLLGRLALRREDLRLLQLRDIDLTQDELYLRHAKGGKEATLPIAFKDVREILYLHLQEREGHADEYLIYPKASRSKPLSRAGIDNWFRRCVAVAGLSGYTMHQLRHAAIDEVIRQTGDWETARQLARHENVQTTQGYVHRDLTWLRERLEGMEAR